MLSAAPNIYRVKDENNYFLFSQFNVCQAIINRHLRFLNRGATSGAYACEQS